MIMIKKEELEKLRRDYPEGCRVELVQMDDDYAPPVGTKGTVKGVDDIGSIMVRWDTGSGLHIIYGVDKCKRVRTCPKCNKEYSQVPAISRYDNKTEICPECATREGMEIAGKDKKEIDEVIGIIKKAENG